MRRAFKFDWFGLSDTEEGGVVISSVEDFASFSDDDSLWAREWESVHLVYELSIVLAIGAYWKSILDIGENGTIFVVVQFFSGTNSINSWVDVHATCVDDLAEVNYSNIWKYIDSSYH